MSIDPADVAPKHFLWDFAQGVATVTLNRPERKNPLTFDSYAELRDTFNALGAMPAVRAVVLTGAGGNFCSGGDVHEIIGPLTKMDRRGLIEFTTMTGDLVKAMRGCPQPIVAAVKGAGVCGRGRDHGNGQRYADCRARRQMRIPVHACGPQQRRHGRLRDPAADHRPWPGGGAAVHRAQHERR